MSVLIFGIEPYLNNPELWKRAMLKADDSHLLKADNNHKNKVIINDEIKGIKQNISASYGYSAARVLHALQTVGHTERHLLGIDIDAVLKRIADSNVLLYGKNRRIGLQEDMDQDDITTMVVNMAEEMWEVWDRKNNK